MDENNAENDIIARDCIGKLKKFIEKGGTSNDFFGQKPFYLHAHVDSFPILKGILESGLVTNVDVPDSDGETPFMLSFLHREDDYKRADLLLKHGANINFEDHHGETALSMCISWFFDYKSETCYLIQRGATLSVKNRQIVQDEVGKMDFLSGIYSLIALCIPAILPHKKKGETWLQRDLLCRLKEFLVDDECIPLEKY